MNLRIFIILFLFVLLNFLTCADTPHKPVTPEELFGWAGAPEDITK